MKISEKIRDLLRWVRAYYRARVPARLGLIGVPVAGFMGPISAWMLTRIIGVGLVVGGMSLVVKRHNDKIRTEVNDFRDKREAKAIEEVKARSERIERSLQDRIAKLVATAEADAAVSERAGTPTFPSKYPVVWPKEAIRKASKR